MVHIIDPNPSYEAEFRAARAEHDAEGTQQHGSGLSSDMSVPDDFAAFVDSLLALRTPEVAYAQDRVPDTKLWLVDGDRYLGCLSLRHELNDYLMSYGGHLGYSVRPAERRKGYATAMTNHALGLARELGLDRILVTTEESNVASQGVVLGCGGIYEDTRVTPEGEAMRRYWIPTGR